MPILDVELVQAAGERPAAGMPAALAEAAAKVLASRPGGTWVRLRTLERSRYAENGGVLDPDVRPVFVTVLRSVLPPPQELEREAAALAAAIAGVCGRPQENVHILYEPPAAARIAFGGRLLGA